MKIGIDARLIEETGVGRYIRNLLTQLALQDKQNEYVIFLRGTSFQSFILPNTRWRKIRADIRWHTIQEQFVMPGMFLREQFDLLHVPYFNVPIFYPKPYVVTIHDLTIVHFNTGKATNLPLPVYWLKRFGYYIIVLLGLSRAKHILTVSEATKQEIMDHVAINERDITVTHEGVEESFKSQSAHLKAEKPIIKNRYFLYVGNAYPHKNLDTLVHAFWEFKKSDTKNTQLVLAGGADIFYEKLRKSVLSPEAEDSIIFFGSANDGQLKNLYRNAVAFVFPSHMEGFGLPGLEAMACGTPVVCSDISVFREIYGEAALYARTDSVVDLASKLSEVSSANIKRSDFIIRGYEQIKHYSWSQLAGQTLSIYRSSVS